MATALAVPAISPAAFCRHGIRKIIVEPIRIRIDASAIVAAFKRLEAGLRSARPMMREVAYLMDAAVADNFAAGGRPKWLGLAPNRSRPSTLQQTGRLRNSIVQFYDDVSATVGTNLVYAPIHQFGGEIHHAPRSGTTRLRTDARGNLLRQSGNPNLAVFARDSHKRVTTVRWTNEAGWTVKIPARPFLQLTDSDTQGIEKVGQRYLQSLIDR